MIGQRGNPFYVEPMLATADPAGSYLRGMQIGEIGRARKAQEAQAERMQEATAAWSAAQTPAEQYRVMRAYPEMAEEFREQLEWHSDQSKNLSLQSGRALASAQSVEDAMRIYQDKVRNLEALGADSSHTRRDMEKIASGEWGLDDIRNAAKVELMGHPEGVEFLSDVQEMSKPLSEFGRLAYDYSKLPEGSPLAPRYEAAMNMKVKEAGGDTANIKDYNQWLEVNKDRLSELPPSEARREMERAFDRILTPPAVVPTGGGGFAVVDRLGSGRDDVVGAEEATEREARLAGAKGQASATGRIEGEKAASAPEDYAKAEQFVGLIDRAIAHPGREAATGMSSIFNPVALPGTGRKDYLVLADQLRGRNFMDAYQSLKGGGQITEIEGERAEKAQARLNTAQSEEEYLAALIEMRDLVKDRMRRIEKRLPEPEKGSGQSGDIERLVNQYAD